MPVAGSRANGSRTAKPNFSTAEYFHVVFTVPEEIAAIAYQNKEVVYGILFRATAETLRTIAADPKHLGAEIGFFAVLHTWGSEPAASSRICIVSFPAAGSHPTATAGSPAGPDFFLPVRVLSRLFRRLFLEYLAERLRCRQTAVLHGAGTAPGSLRTLPVTWRPRERPNGWSMPSARLPDPSRCSTTLAAIPTASPSPTIACWISKTVKCRFQWKDYRHGDQQKTMTLVR